MSKKSSKWYHSHISDEFVKRANKENWRSRAVFKLKEIDEKYNLITPNSNILDLGSAPGGWSQYFTKIMVYGQHPKPRRFVFVMTK